MSVNTFEEWHAVPGNTSGQAGPDIYRSKNELIGGCQGRTDPIKVYHYVYTVEVVEVYNLGIPLPKPAQTMTFKPQAQSGVYQVYQRPTS